MVVFLNSFSGKAKLTGKDFHKVSLGDVSDDGTMKTTDFFTKEPLRNLSRLNFGDVVECAFEESAFLGGKPDLVALKVVSRSPYFENNEKGETE